MENKLPNQPINQSTNYHTPVLYNETLKALNINPSGVYVDCTFGGGGHSKGIIEQLNSEGKLFAFDQDVDAQKNILNDNRIIFVPHNFRYLQKFLRLHKVQQIDGLLADLGVSSHQFDEGSRGFSTRFDGPLDMRMSVSTQATAASILQSYSEQQLHKLFEQYGEVTNAKTLAKHIVQNRQKQPLQTIEQFKMLIHSVVKGNPNKYLAQVFQALRIEVNEEIEALKEMLMQLNDVIKPGGRAAIITFHSLEDRVVKNFFRSGSLQNELPENPFATGAKEKLWKNVTAKPITASNEELTINKRSRSAKLRVAEKI
ncbi:MAG: 16S rRNA (cytosine(1402)-N(4))-methyltransferase RsmH [Chitinophagaceae bacterium]|nr:16S rRNA (cytosine(1402)-N(4))-methyltransferase RsmH [Chitinophagaceae bacterium]MCW5904838.1 16S rRNA (cytosine(1402)-N(4))-methyltransferase RsmH [Chitinophagaceae bacterium]